LAPYYKYVLKDHLKALSVYLKFCIFIGSYSPSEIKQYYENLTTQQIINCLSEYVERGNWEAISFLNQYVDDNFEDIKNLDKKQYYKIKFLGSCMIDGDKYAKEYLKLCNVEDIPDIEKYCTYNVVKYNESFDYVAKYLINLYSKHNLPVSKVRNMITSECVYKEMKQYHKELNKINRIKRAHNGKPNNSLMELNARTIEKVEKILKHYRQIKPYIFSGVYNDIIVVN